MIALEGRALCVEPGPSAFRRRAILHLAVLAVFLLAAGLVSRSRLFRRPLHSGYAGYLRMVEAREVSVVVLDCRGARGLLRDGTHFQAEFAPCWCRSGRSPLYRAWGVSLTCTGW